MGRKVLSHPQECWALSCVVVTWEDKTLSIQTFPLPIGEICQHFGVWRLLNYLRTLGMKNVHPNYKKLQDEQRRVSMAVCIQQHSHSPRIFERSENALPSLLRICIFNFFLMHMVIFSYTAMQSHRITLKG